MVVITLIIAIPLTAATTRLERLGAPRAVGALVSLLLALAVLGGLVALLVPVFLDEVNHFVHALPRIVEQSLAQLRQATGAQRGEIAHRAQDLAQGYTDHPLRLVGPLASIGLGAAGVVAALIVMLLTSVYIAVSPRPLVSGFLRLV